MMVSLVSTDDKTTLSISLTKSEKRFLKIYAAEHDTTISALIHQYIQSLHDPSEHLEEDLLRTYPMDRN